MIEPTISYQGVQYAPIKDQENMPLVKVIPTTAQPIVTQQKKTFSDADKIATLVIVSFSLIGSLSGLGCFLAAAITGDGNFAAAGGITWGVVITCFFCISTFSGRKKC